MWNTSKGMRVLAGPEARAFCAALRSLAEEIDVFHGRDAVEMYGPEVFDRLTWLQKLAVLADVSEALCLESVPAPDLTATNEAAVAAVFNLLKAKIELEIEEAISDPQDELRVWRALTFEALEFVDKGQKPPEEPDLLGADCQELDEWHLCIEVLRDWILWDEDWDMEEDFADQPPEIAAFMRQTLAVSENYFRAVAPDPKEEEVDGLIARIEAVVRLHH